MEISLNLVGLIGFLVVFALIFLNVPIAFSLGLTGFLGIIYLSGFTAAKASLITNIWAYGTHYILMGVPLYILMGQLASDSDIGPDLYETAFKWLGKLPGGLAIATTWGCAGFAACSGSSSAGVMAFTPIAYKPMVDRGYSKRLALATICCSSSMGILIPPSLGFIVYASLTQESAGRLFIAGIFPGILQAVMYTILILVVTGFGIMSGPPGPPSTWRDKFTSLKGTWGMIVLFTVVLGGIYAGIFTPTEAAAIGAFGALLILISRKGIHLPLLFKTMNQCLRSTCMIFTVVIGAMIFTRFVTLTGLNTWLSNWLVGLNISPLAILGVTLIFYLVLGCVMDALSMIVLTVPLLYPSFVALGINGIQFGVLVVVMIELAVVTPPIGMNLFVIRGLIGEEAPWHDLFVGVWPFVGMDIIRVVLLMIFPAICLWLPSKMYG